MIYWVVFWMVQQQVSLDTVSGSSGGLCGLQAWIFRALALGLQ